MSRPLFSKWMEKVESAASLPKGSLMRELLSEFLGTLVLVLVGDGSVAQWVFMNKEAGGFLGVNICYGLAVFLGVLIAGGASGAHLNPAVTVAMATIGKFSFARVIPYIAAQLLGAFVAAGLLFGVYRDALHNFDKGEWNLPALGIWATYPFEAVSNANSFFDQVVGTWILLLSICAITDERNMSVHKMLIPIYVGFTVMAIGMALAFNCGYAINPARDLGPRLFTLFASLGTANKGLPFTANNYFFWIPIVAPIVGGILGAWSYQLMVGFHVAPAPGAPVMEMAEKGQFLPKDTLDAPDSSPRVSLESGQVKSSKSTLQ